MVEPLTLNQEVVGLNPTYTDLWPSARRILLVYPIVMLNT